MSFLVNTIVVDGAFATVVESGDEECFQFRTPANVESTIRSVHLHACVIADLIIYICSYFAHMIFCTADIEYTTDQCILHLQWQLRLFR